MSGALTDTSILAGAAGAGGYTIDQSCRFDPTRTTYLHRTPGTASDQKTWTFSTWAKRGRMDTAQYIFSMVAGYNDTGWFTFEWGSDGTIAIVPGYNYNQYKTSEVFRDPAAWYHLVCRCDTTQSTWATRLRVYVNNELQTLVVSSSQSSGEPAEDAIFGINDDAYHAIAKYQHGTNYLDGYLAEIHHVDGQSLTPSDFAETNILTNQWQAKKYIGTYGTNGFYLKFEDAADLGNDSSGTGNDWTPSSLVATDQEPDTPTNNFCTLNSAVKAFGTVTWTEGNLKAAGSAVYQGTVGTILAGPSGKWYWEHYIHTVGNTFTGVVLPSDDRFFKGIAEGPQQGGKSITYNNNGYTYIDGSQSGSIWGATYTTGDIIGIAVDMDTSNGQVTFYKNGISQGALSFTGNNMSDATNVVPGTVLNGATATFNFGQDSSFAGAKTAQGNTDANGLGDFYYTVPAGYLAPCTSNLPDPSIALPGNHFNTVLYTGNGSTQSITGVGFQPDTVWIKDRTSAESPHLYDAIRGATETLLTNQTQAEFTGADRLTAFDSDGFSLGSNDGVNKNTDNIVSWNWKANGSGSANTDGTLASTVSANTTAGFSIVAYTPTTGSATTVGHGLSQKPDLIIVKDREASTNWPVYQSPQGATYVAWLDDTSASTNSGTTGYWNNVEPTASVFTIGDSSQTGGNTNDYIAYCFHSVEGYQKIGLYEGNSNIDGPFIYTGFRPAFIILKYIDGADWWFMFDSKRPGYNMTNLSVTANDSAAENGSPGQQDIDILSNGFKITDAGGGNNSSGTYLWLAIAKSPFKYSNAR